ncbi:MAG TPA: hypothetical protein VFM60_00460, partial [Salinimicrobium sp.]|nr:hypothetical protein [Salinimicrobium sp.]
MSVHSKFARSLVALCIASKNCFFGISEKEVTKIKTEKKFNNFAGRLFKNAKLNPMNLSSGRQNIILWFKIITN